MLRTATAAACTSIGCALGGKKLYVQLHTAVYISHSDLLPAVFLLCRDHLP